MKKIKVTHSLARQHLPRRTRFDNKSTAGRSLIIGGSKGLAGAAILAAKSATCIGSGYTSLMTRMPKSYYLKFPDFLIHSLPQLLTSKQIKNQAIAIGPGLGVSTKTSRTLATLAKIKHKNVVVDADALTVLSKMKMKLKPPATWVYTPHVGELSRLLKVNTKVINSDPLKYTLLAQKQLGGIVLLKGAETWVVDKSQIYLCTSGHPSLAKAGTGDVLTGLIVGLLAQGILPLTAAWLAAYIHGLAAQDYVKSGRDELSLTPLSLIEQIPKTLHHLRSP
ncbi:MAG: NAD(P)H-hydrate dehydratase [Bdellovibrionales bacterium]